MELYDCGADYVILSHILGGEHAALLIEKMNGSLAEVVTSREHHIKQLKKRRTELIIKKLLEKIEISKKE